MELNAEANLYDYTINSYFISNDFQAVLYIGINLQGGQYKEI